MLGKKVFILHLILMAFTGIVKAETSRPEISKNDQQQTQLERLIIWKMSEELKLGPSEEKKFQDIFLKISSEKANSMDRMAGLTSKLQQAKTDDEKQGLLKDYRKALVRFHQLPVQEMDQMQKLLGVSRYAKYLEVKSDLTQKVKSLILEKADKKPLPRPKVIE